VFVDKILLSLNTIVTMFIVLYWENIIWWTNTRDLWKWK